MKILHLADLHGEYVWYTWLESVYTNYDLVIIAGDLINGMGEHPYLDIELAERVISKIRLKVPVHICSGNHDRWIASWKWLDKQHYTTSYPELVVTSIPWIANDYLRLQQLINSKPQQKEWLVIQHSPPAGSKVATGMLEEGLLNMLPHYPTYICSGHIHSAPWRSQGSWFDKRINQATKETTYLFNPGQRFDSDMPCFIELNTSTHKAVWHPSSGNPIETDLV